MRHQNNMEPACPPQNAENLYTVGRFALVYDATNRSEKSLVISAVHSPMEDNATNAKLAYIARSPLATRSARLMRPPANETVALQMAMSRATQSDSSPRRIT